MYTCIFVYMDVKVPTDPSSASCWRAVYRYR